MDDKNNVIEFPKEKLGGPANVQNGVDFQRQITDYKTSFANDISEILSNYIFGEIWD
jgi:hypothetical protein